MIALNRKRVCPIGLHVSPRSVSMLQVSGGNGEHEIHAMAQSNLEHDANATPEEQDQLTAATLRRMLADHHFKGRQVVSCFGAQELFVQNVRLPQLPDEEVEKVVRWEAEERLPYSVDDAEIRHLPAAQIRQDVNLKQEVILLACHRGVVQRHVTLLEDAGLVPAAIDIEPCAVLRCLQHLTTSGDGLGRYAFLNIGERATTVMFAEGDKVLFLKYVSSGGHDFDVAVSRHLALDLAQARRTRSVVTAAPDFDVSDEIHRTIVEAIRGPLETMAAEIELCLRYYKVTFRGKPLEKMILTGCEASHWLAKYIQDRLGTACEVGNPFESLKRWPTSTSALERPWRWTTPMGLSLK